MLRPDSRGNVYCLVIFLDQVISLVCIICMCCKHVMILVIIISVYPTTPLAVLQHWSEAEPTKVRYSSQHNESEIEGHQEVLATGSGRRDQIRPRGRSSDWASKEKRRHNRLFSRRTDRQAEKWSSRHLIFLCLLIFRSKPLWTHQSIIQTNDQATEVVLS